MLLLTKTNMYIIIFVPDKESRVQVPHRSAAVIVGMLIDKGTSRQEMFIYKTFSTNECSAFFSKYRNIRIKGKFMKSKIFATLLSAIVFANLPVNAIDELTDMRDDGKEAEVKKVLYGQLSDKQVFSLNNYASDAATSGASVDVITREDIKGQNTPFVSTLLNQLGSVTYGQGSGGMGDRKSVV